MKMIALIVDEHGLVHCAATRAPDLVRRAVATATGTRARLVFVALPRPERSAGDVLARALRPLAAARLPQAEAGATAVDGIVAVYRACPEAMALRLAAATRVPSRFALLWSRLERRLRRSARRAAFLFSVSNRA